MDCPACQRETPEEAQFCMHCGARVTPGRAPERDPRAYTPKHLADEILRRKAALEGERKQVTVLFADVKGSMELAEELDPEEWHAVLERFFEILTNGVHRFEGTVNQYTGDGIMALFGAPIAHEDHAQRACHAALHLRDELRGYAVGLRESRGLEFAVRIGLNSGEVVVGKIGDDLRMDYTAQGHSVGIAARLQQLAEPGTIRLSEQTAGLVEGYFELEDQGQTRLAGVKETVGVYGLLGLGALRTRLDVSRARGFSRFVGRADELDALESALEGALRGHGRVAGVVAEAGIGKSRLCHELSESCRARGVAIHETRGIAHGRQMPMLPILELLRSVFGIEDGDPGATARGKITDHLLRLKGEDPQAELPLVFAGMAHASSAHWVEAIGLLEHVVERIEERGFPKQGLGRALTALARAYLGAERLAEAGKAAERAVRTCRTSGMKSWECMARLVLARIRLTAEGKSARRKVRAGLERAEQLVEETAAEGYRPFICEVRSMLARVAGDTDAAQTELREARRLFSEMGATEHAERVERELSATD